MDTETMRYYYTSGLWPLKGLAKLLQAGRITQEQYDEIIKEEAK